MKKLIFGLSVMVLLSGALTAQEDAEKALKTAGKAMGAYNLDPAQNKSKLQEAVTAIDIAAEGAETGKLVKTWQLKGEIYNEIATQIVTVRQLGIGKLDDLPKVKHPALQASGAFQKAFELSEKKYEKKDALKGLQVAQSNLYNLGIYAYEDKDYALAFNDFQEVIKVHDLLKANGEASSLDAEGTLNDQMYITGLAGLNAEKVAEAKPYFEKLYAGNYDKPAIYEALYKLKAEENIEEAYKYLETGRKKYPDDISLLFAEINHYLRLNKLDELIGELKMAIEKEPNNISLYSTLGNVYDNLYQREYAAGNIAKSDEYFNSAFDYYNQALSKDPTFLDAIYSIGALYYNKAATMSKELNTLANDLSKEGQKKYDTLHKEIEMQFDKALPYFQKAESMNPNDVNTLIALKEIFARKDDFEKSNEFKKRFEVVNGGGKNESSYFKQ